MKKYRLTVEGVRADLTPDQVREMAEHALRTDPYLRHEPKGVLVQFDLLSVTHVEDVTAGIVVDNELWQVACPMHERADGTPFEQPHAGCRYCGGSGLAMMTPVKRGTA